MSIHRIVVALAAVVEATKADVLTRKLAEIAEGLDFSDPEDRASFRMQLFQETKNQTMDVLRDWMVTNAPGMKMPGSRHEATRLLADVYMQYKPVVNTGWQPQPRRQRDENVGALEDVTSKLSRDVRDAGFTLTRRKFMDTDTGAMKYQYDFQRNGHPVLSRGSKPIEGVREANEIAKARIRRDNR